MMIGRRPRRPAGNSLQLAGRRRLTREGRMTEILFPLDAAGRWRLAHDDLQWIVQRRKGPVDIVTGLMTIKMHIEL